MLCVHLLAAAIPLPGGVSRAYCPRLRCDTALCDRLMYDMCFRDLRCGTSEKTGLVMCVCTTARGVWLRLYVKPKAYLGSLDSKIRHLHVIHHRTDSYHKTSSHQSCAIHVRRQGPTMSAGRTLGAALLVALVYAPSPSELAAAQRDAAILDAQFAALLWDFIFSHMPPHDIEEKQADRLAPMRAVWLQRQQARTTRDGPDAGVADATDGACMTRFVARDDEHYLLVRDAAPPRSWEVAPDEHATTSQRP